MRSVCLDFHRMCTPFCCTCIKSFAPSRAILDSNGKICMALVPFVWHKKLCTYVVAMCISSVSWASSLRWPLTTKRILLWFSPVVFIYSKVNIACGFIHCSTSHNRKVGWGGGLRVSVWGCEGVRVWGGICLSTLLLPWLRPVTTEHHLQPHSLTHSLTQGVYDLVPSERVTLYFADNAKQELWIAVAKDDEVKVG